MEATNENAPASAAPSGASPTAEEGNGARWRRAGAPVAAVVRVAGTLRLAEPLHLGGTGGDEPENVSDLPLLTDPRSGCPLLPGTTLAGALRSYLDARERGFPAGRAGEKSEERGDMLATALFGGGGGAGDPAPSAVRVDDALGEMPGGASVETYMGNRLSGPARTAAEGALYSRTTWPAGTTFDLHFELPLPADRQRAARYCTALVSALRGLDAGEQAGVRLGGRKRRGFGRVDVEEWRLGAFDLSDPEGLLDWVYEGGQPLAEIDSRRCGSAEALGEALGDVLVEEGGADGKAGGAHVIPDARKLFFVEARCALPHGLLDRTAGTTGEPDVAHRRAYDAERGEERPVLTGTQVGGALRAQAHRIARALGPEGEAEALVEAVFGSAPEREELRAGRLWIDRSFVGGEERERTGLMDLVQNRIRLDPWTQAPARGALFDERPVRGGEDVEVTLRWQLDQPRPAEVGLLLHLLKDLWSGDLAVAGTQSIGRGQFRGRKATLALREGPESVQAWTFEATGEDGPGLRFEQGTPEDLSRYAAALTDHLSATPADSDASAPAHSASSDSE
jgi:CRISPR/Cas system CMR subunit Cmr4 (Cas7 group RAMP superfamily)